MTREGVPWVVGTRYRSRAGSIRFHDTQECDSEANRALLQCLPPPNYPITVGSPEARYGCDACGRPIDPEARPEASYESP